MLHVPRETDSELEQYEMQFRDHAAISSKRDFFMVDPRKLKVDDSYNVRATDSKETRDHIANLKASIIANGVKVPLEVRLGERDQLYIVAGHCRHVAVMEAIADGIQIDAVPCIPEPKGTDEQDRVVNLIVSNSGKPLAPLEVAAVVKRLDAYGWEHKKIAERLGWKSPVTVKQHLDLLALPESVKKHVRDGNVSATLARNISKNADPVAAAARIAANLEENKRIKCTSKKRSTKVTAKTIKRDAPKPQEPETVQGGYTAPAGDKPAAPATGSGVMPAHSLPSQTEVDASDWTDYRPTQRHPEPIPSALAATPESNPPQNETVSVLIELTKQAHLCVQHNQSDDHPGYWTKELVEAIRNARDIVERLTGRPMEFETLPDATSQEVEHV